MRSKTIAPVLQLAEADLRERLASILDSLGLHSYEEFRERAEKNLLQDREWAARDDRSDTNLGGRRRRISEASPDCGVDQVDGWKRTLEDGRELARRFQVRTVARDYPVEVAQVLRDKGWSVMPPEDFDEREGHDALRGY